MKVHYYADTDSLYIDLLEKPSADSREAVPGVVLDFDEAGHLVGIDIDHASPARQPVPSRSRKPPPRLYRRHGLKSIAAQAPANVQRWKCENSFEVRDGEH